jgi:hypothetical protein
MKLLMMKMIMSMKRDYVSDLRLPTDLLFIPQMIYKHRNPGERY